jgi:hypothetical protein
MKKLLVTLMVLTGISSQAAFASAREEARLIEALACSKGCSRSTTTPFPKTRGRALASP